MFDTPALIVKFLSMFSHLLGPVFLLDIFSLLKPLNRINTFIYIFSLNHFELHFISILVHFVPNQYDLHLISSSSFLIPSNYSSRLIKQNNDFLQTKRTEFYCDSG